MCEVMEKYMNKVKHEANITAVVNMLLLNINEDSVKKCYPDEFEEGKKRFLENKND